MTPENYKPFKGPLYGVYHSVNFEETGFCCKVFRAITAISDRAREKIALDFAHKYNLKAESVEVRPVGKKKIDQFSVLQ